MTKHQMTVFPSISAQCSFEASSTANICAGRTILITPEREANAPEQLLGLVESNKFSSHLRSGEFEHVTRGQLIIIGRLNGGDIEAPIGRVPYFRGDISVPDDTVLAKLFSRVEHPGEKDGVAFSLLVGHVRGNRAIDVVFDARGLNRHTALLAQSGSGKSYALAVLLEEILSKTLLNVIVFDFNGDFGAFGERGDWIHVPAGVTMPSFEVLSLSDLDARVRSDVVAARLRELWEGRGSRQPTMIVVDEVHNALLEKSEILGSCDYIERIAAEGRKYGLWLLIATQRPSRVPENILSQCDNLVLMRTGCEIDLEYTCRVYGRLTEDLARLARGFDRGESIAVGPLVKCPTLLRFRKRRSTEGGGDIPAETWARV